MFKCGDGRCVKPDKICDGKFDCIDAADERDCGRLFLCHPILIQFISDQLPIIFQICVLRRSGDVRGASVLTRAGGVTGSGTVGTGQTSWTALPPPPACPSSRAPPGSSAVPGPRCVSPPASCVTRSLTAQGGRTRETAQTSAGTRSFGVEMASVWTPGGSVTAELTAQTGEADV